MKELVPVTKRDFEKAVKLHAGYNSVMVGKETRIYTDHKKNKVVGELRTYEGQSEYFLTPDMIEKLNSLDW